MKKSYIDGLEWDGVPRVEKWLNENKRHWPAPQEQAELAKGKRLEINGTPRRFWPGPVVVAHSELPLVAELYSQESRRFWPSESQLLDRALVDEHQPALRVRASRRRAYLIALLGLLCVLTWVAFR